MTEGTTTLILGGGFGGLTAANALRRLVPKEHRIVVVDWRKTFYVGATKTWVMLGEATPDQVSRSLDVLPKRGIEWVHAEIRKIDAAARQVTIEPGPQLPAADYLVIALGVEFDMAAIPGLHQAAETFYTMPGAVRLRETLRTWAGGELAILNPRTPIQCPPAPYEAAMRLDHALKLRGLREKTKISLYTVEPVPMPTAGPEIGRIIKEELAKRNIGLHLQKKVKSADAGKRVVLFEDGSEARYDLLISVPPHVAPKAVRDSGLTNASGWIPVDPKTLRIAAAAAADRVYAIGDVTVVPLPGRYKPDVPLVLPKAGVTAEAHGQIVAARIAAHIAAKDPSAAFDGIGHCFVEMGDDHALKAEGHFFDTPIPKIIPRAADQEQMKEKRRWIDGFLKTNL